MAEYSITRFFSNEGTRNEVRMRVVAAFAEELPGTGRNEDASRYTYYVETLSDGNRIFLRRPANLHNGFDFLVCVENYNFNENGLPRRNNPKHTDIIKDLQLKKDTQPTLYRRLFDLIEQVYLCHELRQESLQNLNFNVGFTSEVIIKTLKWFFIEQDIRYWNYSGRDMLWGGIPRP